jgi:release factor glutamine methyltransferase
MAGLRGPFDVIAFNPPYLEGPPSDPIERAWQGGEAGSEVAVRFLSDLPRVLGPGGRAYLLLSRANAPARSLAETAFAARVVATKALFFERLEVLELRVRAD